MSDNNRLRNSLIVIGAILTIIWTFIQINKETQLVKTLIQKWNELVNWFLTTKIPLTWIILIFIMYYVIKYLLSKRNIDVNYFYDLEEAMRENAHYRYAVKLCEKPKTINELRSRWNSMYTGNFDGMVEHLEQIGGLLYDEERGQWISSEVSLKYLEKYGT